MKLNQLLFIFFLLSVSVLGQSSEKIALKDKNIRVWKTDRKRIKIARIYRVKIYEDGTLLTRYYFRRGLLIKASFFNTQTKRWDCEIKYFYLAKGKLRDVEAKGSCAEAYADPSWRIQYEQDEKNLKFQSEYLKSKNIKIADPELTANEISDLTEVLSVADNYSDYRTKTSVKGNRKTIKFLAFNKKLRLYNSRVSMLIYLGGTINFTIKDYTLVLTDGYPSREVFKTDGGEVTREYFYEGGKIIKLVHTHVDLQNVRHSIVNRFEYHKLS